MPGDDEHATAREVNGFGGRLNKVEISQAEERTKTRRNEQDITKLFELASKNVEAVGEFEQATTKQFGEVQTLVAISVGAIDKKVSNLKWWMLGGLGAVGTVLKLVL